MLSLGKDLNSYRFFTTWLKYCLFIVLFISSFIFYLNFISLSPSPCDYLLEEHCAKLSSWSAYECLRKLDRSKKSEDCNRFLKVHLSCRFDVNKHCSGYELTGSLESCLSRVQNLTKPCYIELNPPWKSNTHIHKYQERRLEERRQ